MNLAQKKCRKSHQREVILEEIRKTDVHPTAKELYTLVRKKCPNIGMATIYRNLDHLEKSNQIIRLRTKNNETRYDGKISKHCHLICKKCNHIIDLMDVDEIVIKSKELKNSKFKIDPQYAEIFGSCQSCC